MVGGMSRHTRKTGGPCLKYGGMHNKLAEPMALKRVTSLRISQTIYLIKKSDHNIHVTVGQKREVRDKVQMYQEIAGGFVNNPEKGMN